MKLKAISDPDIRESASVAIVPFFHDEKKAKIAFSAKDLEKVVDPIILEKDFTGKEEQTLLFYHFGDKEKRILFLGLGKEEKCQLETLRRSFAAAMKRCQNKKWPILNVFLPSSKKWSLKEIGRAISEGVGLASYTFEEKKSKKNQNPFYVETVYLIGLKEESILKETSALLTGVNLARNLINRNGFEITPYSLASYANSLAKEHSEVKTTVLNKAKLEKENMHLLLAVGQGAGIDPALVIAEYKGDKKSNDLTMVIGKGVTFDTGGLNLKPTNFIEDMRSDMSGGAAALGIIQSAAALKLKKNIVALIPTTENAIGPKSYKPGDVYGSFLGKTVEITNTDAEGRLILADALAYGEKNFSPKRIIDLATLTGAIVVALGGVRAGFYSNHDKLAKLLMESGEETGERVWRMPLDADYKKLLKSDIADIKNAANKRAAGSITAALFLKEFISDEIPWIHLDIAGVAFLDAPEYYHLSRATGVGVRLILNFLEKIDE